MRFRARLSSTNTISPNAKDGSVFERTNDGGGGNPELESEPDDDSELDAPVNNLMENIKSVRRVGQHRKKAQSTNSNITHPPAGILGGGKSFELDSFS
jgi:hypothetical protein